MTDDGDDGPDKSGAGVETGADVSLSVNAILDLLAHHHRRAALRFLIDEPDHTASVNELVSHLVTREAEWTGKRPGRTEIETNLHHVHLPKLTDSGVVEYDARSQEIRYWHHDRLEDLLEYVQSYETE